LKTQVMPYLLSFDSPTALSEHLQVITLEDWYQSRSCR
jgi:hypothetical protein